MQGDGVIEGSNVIYESTSASTFSGSIQGAGEQLTLDAGTGRLVLTGSNTFTGGADTLSGTLIVASAYALPDGSSLTVGARGMSMFDAAASADVPSPLAGAGGAAAVPEPGTLLLLLAAVAFGLVARRPEKKASFHRTQPLLRILQFEPPSKRVGIGQQLYNYLLLPWNYRERYVLRRVGHTHRSQRPGHVGRLLRKL